MLEGQILSKAIVKNTAKVKMDEVTSDKSKEEVASDKKETKTKLN